MTVTTAGGTSGTGEHYTFDAAPTLTAVTPSAGKTTAGALGDPHRHQLHTGPRVKFGTTAATTVTVTATTTIKVKTPAHAAGTVHQ